MSASIAVSALTFLARWRSNSNGVFGAARGREAAAEAVAVEEVEDVERGDLEVAADRLPGPRSAGSSRLNVIGPTGWIR